MFDVVFETSYQAALNYFILEKNVFDSKYFYSLKYPLVARRPSLPGLADMIESTVKMRTKLAKKAKTVLHSLHWFLCAAVTDFSHCPSPGDGSSVDEEIHEATSVSELPSQKQCDVITFQHLPPEVKLKVFSYLTMEEKGRVERVCWEWRDLVRTPLLWGRVDLTQFSPSCKCSSSAGGCCSSMACYETYKYKMEQFIAYLTNISPTLKEFRFAFDINDCQDDWLQLLRGFFDSINLEKLEVAQLNWKETPVKPYQSQSATWSSNNYNDLMYRHRRRQRHFVGFFDYFTALAKNLSTLILPFDWSVSSVRFLARLERLQTLVLESYFVPQPLEQEMLDDLLRSIPNVQHLSMTVCIGSGLGLVTYKLASKTLRSLDISGCQGFSLEEVCLPSLTAFRTSCKPSVCPLLDITNTTSCTPCIYEVLCSGAPHLVHLNNHRLHLDWRENRYEELETVLRSICSCPLHKPV